MANTAVPIGTGNWGVCSPLSKTQFAVTVSSRHICALPTGASIKGEGS